MIRLIVRVTNTSNMTAQGGTHHTSYMTFDVDLPEVEAVLRACDGNNQYQQHQLVGVELKKD